MTQFGYRRRDLSALDESLTDARAARVVGIPIDVVRAEYRNPFEIVLGGSGFLLGAIYVLRLIRDWSHIRRIGAAQAEQAESIAWRATTHAEFSQWLVDEATGSPLCATP